MFYDELLLSSKLIFQDVSPVDSGSFTGYTLNALNVSLKYDSREALSGNSEGHFFNFSFEKGGDVFGFNLGGIEYKKWKIEIAKFWKVQDEAVIALRSVYGIFNRSSEIQTFEGDQFFLGGANTLRGFREQALNGEQLFFTNLEYRVAMSQAVQGVLFMDIGSVSTVQKGFKDSYFSKGVGIRFLTGLTPFRFDIAWSNEIMLHFNIGQMF